MKGNLLLAVTTLSIAGSAWAGDLGTANQFNAFLFGNADTNGGHSDGAMAVGGNWFGSGYDALQANLGATVGSATNIGIYVGGNVTFTSSGSINNSGNGYVNGNFQGNTFNMNGGTLFYGGTATGVNGSKTQQAGTVLASTFNDQQLYSQQQSSYLAGLAGAAIDTTDLNNWNVNAALQGGNLKVYTIGAADLNKLRTLNFSNLTAADTVVINVAGASVAGFGITVNTNTGGYNQLLWNFSSASSITIDQRAFHGSILAPGASVMQTQNIDGNLIATNLTVRNGAELHQARFTGNVPVPEPATIIASLVGLAGVAARRRRRRSL